MNMPLWLGVSCTLLKTLPFLVPCRSLARDTLSAEDHMAAFRDVVLSCCRHHVQSHGSGLHIQLFIAVPCPARALRLQAGRSRAIPVHLQALDGQ